MLKEVDHILYKNTVTPHLSNNYDFLEITSEILRCEVVLYLYYNREEPVIALALLKKGKRIILPNFQLFYSGIWLKYSLEHKNGRDYLYNAIEQLKKEYIQIRLMIPVEVTDLRMFIWNQFSIKLRYTYLKKTASGYTYKKDVEVNYGKSKVLPLSFTKIFFKDFDWVNHSKHLLQIGYSIYDIKMFKNWFNRLDQKGMLLCFQVHHDTKIVGSGILLLDKLKRTAYFITRNIHKVNHLKEINAYVYIEVLKYLNEQGYTDLDYMGANIRPVADFKERFLPTLTPYYIVEYNYFSIDKIIEHLKKKYRILMLKITSLKLSNL